jgi:tRNA-2-methylthio-N6-dimethylallyladenosine synthase
MNAEFLELPVLPVLPQQLSTAPFPELEVQQNFVATTTKKVYVETYGCSMNTADSEVVLSVLSASGYHRVETADTADVVLLNTCAIRDNAEKKIHERLIHLKYNKKRNKHLLVGLLGCMAERLRTKLLDNRMVDLVVGPDEYRKMPELLQQAAQGLRGVAVQLSRVETYDDIVPLRTEGISAFLSISRGCDKFCTFCVVPFTRGRERSRSISSIVAEVKGLEQAGFKEVTLLGQNVNSFMCSDSTGDFADLLRNVAKATTMRIRYQTSHPQDMSTKLIETMAEYENLCKYIHLPVQSGSNRILELMNRTYSVEHYLERIAIIRTIMPHAAITTDIIAGFCTETEADHQATLDLMREVRYDGAYMFAYSPRENTKAWKMGDDVADEIKISRLQEIIELQNSIALEKNSSLIGSVENVLAEGASRKNPFVWQGRTDSNKRIFFDHEDVRGYVVGDTVQVRVTKASQVTLNGMLV